MKIEWVPRFIPSELKPLRQWVGWSLEYRQGRPTKVPRTVDGDFASVRDPNTWATFDEILASGQPPGFVLTADDPYCCLDLDHVREGNTTQEWAVEIIRRN